MPAGAGGDTDIHTRQPTINLAGVEEIAVVWEIEGLSLITVLLSNVMNQSSRTLLDKRRDGNLAHQSRKKLMERNRSGELT